MPGLRDATDVASHRSYPIASRQLVAPGKPWSIAGVCFEAFAVDHSTRAPAVGYRVSIGSLAIFYVPDVVAIRRPASALAGVALYIGDGASLVRPILRRQPGRRIGHTTIGEQLRWCAATTVRDAIFTHCGSWIAKDGRRADALLRRFARQFGVAAGIAYDGLRIVLSA